MSDVRGQMSDVIGQMSDVRSQMSDVRSQMSEVRGQKIEVGNVNAEIFLLFHDNHYHSEVRIRFLLMATPALHGTPQITPET